MAKYKDIANQLVRQFQQSHYVSGDKLPSIRELATFHRVSVSTAVKVYEVLEDQGWVKSISKTGYFLGSTNLIESELDSVEEPKPVELSDFVKSILSDARNNNVPLGSAHPNIRFPSIQRLYKQLAKAAREEYLKPSQYLPPGGDIGLKTQVVRQLATRGVNATTDEVVITQGGHEAIRLALASLVHHGDIIAITSPGYFGYLFIAKLLGLKVIEIPYSAENGVSLKAFKRILEEWPVKALVLSSSFINPLGTSMPLSQKKILATLIDEYNLPTIEDDVFGELYYDKKPETLFSLVKQANIIFCGSFSKSLDSRVRVGFVVDKKQTNSLIEIHFLANLSGVSLI